MKRLGVVSDTHMPRFGRELPRGLRDGLSAAGVDLIVHLGDFTSIHVVGLLERIAPLEAVAGNNDPAEIVRAFGRRRILEVEGVRFGLVHGDEGRAARTVDRAASAFAASIERPVDAVLFGHSHEPAIEWRHGVLLFNPGSPTDKRRQPHYSYGLIEVSGDSSDSRVDGRLDARLLTYDDRSV